MPAAGAADTDRSTEVIQQLQDRINECVLNGDAPSLIRMMEGQIRIVAQLEATNAALREATVRFAGAVGNTETMEPHVLEAYEALLDVLYPSDALVTFATVHGIPLPSEESQS